MKRRHLSTEERIRGDGGGRASGGGDPRVAVKVASRHPEPGWESPAPPLLDLDCGLRTLNEQSLLLKPPASLRSREEALGEGAQCPGRGCSVPGLDSFHVAGAEGPAGGRRASAGASGLGSPACPLPLASGPGGSQEGAAAGTIARTAETRGGPRPRPPALAAGVGAPSFPRRALSSLPAPCLAVPTGVVEGAWRPRALGPTPQHSPTCLARPRLRLRGGSSWTCGTLATLRPLRDEPASVLCEEPGGTRPSRPCHPGEGPNAEDRDNPTHECRPSARPTGPRAS